MPEQSPAFNLKGWALIPGPIIMDEPRSSVDLDDPVMYPSAAIAGSILAYPGMMLIHSAEPSWWEWKARWQSHERYIESDMTLFADEEQSRGGSGLTAVCLVTNILALWSFMLSRHRGIWMHDPDCNMYMPAAFAEKMAGGA